MTFKKEYERVFKPLKELNAEIRTIENEQYEDKTIYWIVDVGMLESLGEQGYIYTFTYEEKPTEEEIIKDIKEHIKEQIEELNNSLLNAYEEKHLKELKKIKLI